MAGFFGLFNYEKEGPGVSKDAPKKRGIFRFFEFYFRNFWRLITVNLVHTLVCLPIVTNGLAQVGVTNVARNIARDKHSFGVSDFIDTIKKNWKQALPAGIINILIYIILIFDIWFFNQMKSGIFSTICLAVAFLLLFFLTIMNYYIWTMMITFKFTLKQIYSNSFKFVIINMKYNLLCFFVLLLVNAIYVGILFLVQGYWLMALMIEGMVYLLTYPAFRALLIQFCTFPSIKKYIIDPYYEEHPDEDVQKRMDLGIDVETPKKVVAEGEEGEEEEPENVFED